MRSMSAEPPNPYAPGATATDDVPAEPEKAQAPVAPARWLAVLTALAVHIPMGLGLYVLGRKRRAVVWAAIGLVEVALFYASALSGHAKLLLLAMTLLVTTWLAAIVDTDYLKRVVAVEGDVVQIRDDVVSINGRDLPQQTVDERCPPPDDQEGCKVLRETDGRRSYLIMLTGPSSPDFSPTLVPPGNVFVLGDNRRNSSDSRIWGFVPVENIKGVTSFIWWSRGGGGRLHSARKWFDAIRWERIGKRPTDL